MAKVPERSIVGQSFKASRTGKVAAAGLFAALAILLTTISQGLGLNFPILPYLQFDLGEVAILLGFLMFGPLPAVAAAVVEFLTLMAIGQNAPYGPILKIVAVLASVGGLWLGMMLAKKAASFARIRTLLGSGLALGFLSRVIFMTIANYYLIAFVYTIGGMVSLVSAPLRLVGISISSTNALSIILGFTGLFNCLQLGFAFGISYFLVRLPQIRRLIRTSKITWYESLAERKIDQRK